MYFLGLKNYSGSCDAGYWCKTEAKSKQPSEEAGKQGPCPPGGYYCPEGSADPQPCPAGRYSPLPKSMLKSLEECDLCPAGKYCQIGTQTVTSGNCMEGYFCIKGSPSMQPNSTYGGMCPPGTYCPSGSSWPIPCEAGTYNNISQQAKCKWCPPGFYCPANSTFPIECPPGNWCENGTTDAYSNSCPPGTFNSLFRQSSRSDCTLCTPGSYCDKHGK